MKKVDIMFRGGGGRKPKTPKAPVVTPDIIINGANENAETPAKQEEPAPEKPKRNGVILRLFQDTFKEVKQKGEIVKKAVKHFMEFSFETTERIESVKLSDWLIAQLAKYQIMQKAQGKAAFDQSLPIEMSILVSSVEGIKEVQSGIKFSTNAKTLERILTQYPTVVSMVFNPTTFDYGTTKAAVMQLVNGVNSTIAPAVEQPALNVNEQGELQNNLEKALGALEHAE